MDKDSFIQLLLHVLGSGQSQAEGNETQVAGDVVPFQGKPSDSYIYTPGNQLYQPGQSTNPGGKPMEMPWWMMYYPWPAANKG